MALLNFGSESKLGLFWIKRSFVCLIHIAGAHSRELHEKVVPDLHDDSIVMTSCAYQPAKTPFVLLTEMSKVSTFVTPCIRAHDDSGVAHLVGKPQPVEKA
ncbi:hypothetical protein D3C76_1343220 [compost metagenome]